MPWSIRRPPAKTSTICTAQRGWTRFWAALVAAPSTPDPLRREPPPAEPYPLEALGPILGPAVRSLHRIIQAPDALIAQSLLAAAALCVQPHANAIIDGRVLPLSLFCLTVGASGERKSAVDTLALKPVVTTTGTGRGIQGGHPHPQGRGAPARTDRAGVAQEQGGRSESGQGQSPSPATGRRRHAGTARAALVAEPAGRRTDRRRLVQVVSNT